MVTNNENWDNDLIQFARLLCEIMATQNNIDFAALAESMDLEESEIKEIFDRANNAWDEATGRQRINNGVLSSLSNSDDKYKGKPRNIPIRCYGESEVRISSCYVAPPELKWHQKAWFGVKNFFKYTIRFKKKPIPNAFNDILDRSNPWKK